MSNAPETPPEATPPQQPAAQPPPAPPPPVNPNQIVPGHYTAPMSVRAAASFKRGSLHGPAITGQPKSLGALIALVVLGLLAIGGMVGAVLIRSMKAGNPPAASATTPPAPPPAETTQPAASQASPLDSPNENR